MTSCQLHSCKVKGRRPYLSLLLEELRYASPEFTSLEELHRFYCWIASRPRTCRSLEQGREGRRQAPCLMTPIPASSRGSSSSVPVTQKRREAGEGSEDCCCKKAGTDHASHLQQRRILPLTKEGNTSDCTQDLAEPQKSDDLTSDTASDTQPWC